MAAIGRDPLKTVDKIYISNEAEFNSIGTDTGKWQLKETQSAENFEILREDVSKLTINTSGNVGIGITNPAQTLDVNGNINITDGNYFTNNSINAIPYIYLRDEKTANTAGGNFTSGAWRTRVLNTEVADTHNLCTLSSNQFTLPAGTYKIEASAPAYRVQGNKAKLYNITDTSDTIIGTSTYSGNDTNNVDSISFVKGIFTIADTKTFELQHRGNLTHNTVGFGNQSNMGVVEVYSEVELWRLY
jgi:hypothetical protein